MLNLHSEIKFTHSYEGYFLLAHKKLDGSVFERAVIYICAHDENGAVGLVTNRIMGEIDIVAVLDYATDSRLLLPSNLAKKHKLFFGGPLEPSKMMVITTGLYNDDSRDNIVIHQDIEGFLHNYLAAHSKSDFIITRGISGWEASQLEQEIADNSWVVFRFPDPNVVFSSRIKDKWRYAAELLNLSDFSKLPPYIGHA